MSFTANQQPFRTIALARKFKTNRSLLQDYLFNVQTLSHVRLFSAIPNWFWISDFLRNSGEKKVADWTGAIKLNALLPTTADFKKKQAFKCRVRGCDNLFWRGMGGGVISNFPCTMYSTCHSQQAQSTFWRIKMLLNDWLTHMGRMGRFPEMLSPHLKSWNLILSKFFQCKICIRCLQTRDWDFALFENWEVQRRQKGFEFLIEMLNFLWRDWLKKLWIVSSLKYFDLWHWKKQIIWLYFPNWIELVSFHFGGGFGGHPMQC